MQGKASAYLAKRIGDELLASPKPKRTEMTDDLDGQPFVDDAGNRLGTYRRMPNVSVYLVTRDRAATDAELEACLADPVVERIQIQRADNQITGVIYLQDPSKAPALAEALRADDV